MMENRAQELVTEFCTY